MYYVVFLSVNSLDSSHALQELESEDEEVDDDAEDEHEHETEDATPAEPAMNKAAAPPAPPKDTERQLSKKELKKRNWKSLMLFWLSWNFLANQTMMLKMKQTVSSNLFCSLSLSYPSSLAVTAFVQFFMSCLLGGGMPRAVRASALGLPPKSC